MVTNCVKMYIMKDGRVNIKVFDSNGKLICENWALNIRHARLILDMFYGSEEKKVS